MQFMQVRVHPDHHCQMQQRVQLCTSGREEGLSEPEDHHPEREGQNPRLTLVYGHARVGQHYNETEMSSQFIYYPHPG